MKKASQIAHFQQLQLESLDPCPGISASAINFVSLWTTSSTMHLPDAHTEFVLKLDIPSYAIVAALALIAGIALWIWFR
jgi:hypothetical protein